MLPHELDELLLEVPARRDDVVQGIRPDDEDALVTLPTFGVSPTTSHSLNEGTTTYDERSALLLVRAGQEHHRLKDLNPSVLVDEDGVGIFLTKKTGIVSPVFISANE